jgi:hypothetical protein
MAHQIAGDKEALVHCAHDIVRFAQAHEVRADDRSDDAHTADQKGQGHQVFEQFAHPGQEQGGQHHGGADGDDIGFEQVGSHSGAVAHVVAHIVRDYGRVARVVFRDTGLDLADQIGANVCCLGEDTAAETREDGD